jgi:phage tail-like protein
MAPPGQRKNPLTGFLFGFKITEGPLESDYTAGTAFFRQVSGIKNDNEVTDYQEGGVTAWTRKVIGVRKWPNLVLKQGFTGDTRFFKWKWAPKRVNGMVVQLGANLNEVCRWTFTNGYPVKWEGPDFDAAKNEIAIETLEIAHEGLEFENAAPVESAPEQESETEPEPEAPFPEAQVNFDTDKSNVKPNEELQAIIDALKENPDKQVVIEGHTDGDGSAAYNKTLSQQRADSTKSYLIAQGVQESQIVSAVGYGEERPINPIPEKTAAEKAANRRTTVKPA